MHREDAMASVDDRLNETRLIEEALTRIKDITSSRGADEVTYRFGLATGYIAAILHAGVIDEAEGRSSSFWSSRRKNPNRFQTEQRAGLTCRCQHIVIRETVREGHDRICMGIPDEATMPKHPQTRTFGIWSSKRRCGAALTQVSQRSPDEPRSATHASSLRR